MATAVQVITNNSPKFRFTMGGGGLTMTALPEIHKSIYINVFKNVNFNLLQPTSSLPSTQSFSWSQWKLFGMHWLLEWQAN